MAVQYVSQPIGALFALDTMNSLVISIMILLSAAFDSVLLVDLAIVYCGLSFVATMYLGRYIERRSR